MYAYSIVSVLSHRVNMFVASYAEDYVQHAPRLAQGYGRFEVI